MAFRDSFDKCPRCGVTLEDAHSARGCRSCGGMFVEEPVLAEMLLKMLPPPPRSFGPLRLSARANAQSPLPCPQCGEPMEAGMIDELELDRCKKHGVWFDIDELRLTLFRVADPSKPPPFNEPAAFVPPSSRPPAPTARPPKVDHGAPRLMFTVQEPNLPRREVSLQASVLKLGRMTNANFRIEDEAASRMHAVIEATRKQTHNEILIIDLGSATGTYVNGERTNKTTLKLGDTIQVGETVIGLVDIT